MRLSELANLQKVVKVNLSDQICASLRDKISSGEFPVGSRLPSETELAEIFGVSRLTVRMALQKLSTQGLTVTKPGDGTFVKEFDIVQYINEVSDITLRPEMLDSVLEFRLCLEGTAIHLVIERASDEEVGQLEALMLRMKEYCFDAQEPEEVWQSKFDGYVELDYQFHATLCKISGNSLFHLAFAAARAPVMAYLRQITGDRISSFRSAHPELSSFNIEEMMHQAGDHEEIVRAIKSRDHAACTTIFQGPIDYKKVPGYIEKHK